MVDEAETPTTRAPSTTIARAGAALALVLAGLVPILAGPAAADAQPDLVVRDLEVHDFQVVGGERLGVEAEVANVGNATERARTRLAFRLDDGRVSSVEVEVLHPTRRSSCT